ncbi:hypothetical protein BGZ89_011078 [Linnemannia elongata]|nr:hypothetical protein BGZ89_011078 [Linnemannia elongata]
MTSRSSTNHRLSSSNSDTLLSSSEDESTILPRARESMAEDVSQLAVASNPLLSVGDGGTGVGSSSSVHTMASSLTRASTPASERQQHQHHYYRQQQPQQQYGYGYFDASSRGTQTPENSSTRNNIYAGTGAGVGSGNSSSRAAETIIHFPDQIPTLQLVSFTPPPSSPVEGSSSSATPHLPYAHAYPHPHHQNADIAAPPSSSSGYYHPLPAAATTITPSHIDDLGAEHSSKFQEIRKRFSLGAMGAGGTVGVVGDRIGRRTSLTNNNNSSRKEPVRQWTKDSTKTLANESTAALLMREDLKDESSLILNKVGGVEGGGGGVGLAMNRRMHSATSGTIHFQESEYAGVTRRGSTMTFMSGNTQTTYRLNVNIPHKDYYPEKVGYGHPDHHGYNTNSKSNPALNLSTLSLIATSPTTPNTPHDSIFGQAGSNNNNPAPNGKRYIDTRKRNKQQKKEEKALAKASFKKRKTLFSNERTFIHWIKFGMLLGALAMMLLNFSGEGIARREGVDQTLANRVGRIGQNVGVTLLLICLLCLVYSGVSYHWRHLGIAKDKGHERYFDRVGPTFLTVALLATYTMNVVLTIQVSSLMDQDYEPSIYLNNNNLGPHALPPLTPSPSTSPPSAAIGSDETAPAQPIILPPAPEPSPEPPLTQPQRPVFDTPNLPPGSTILIDSDEDDGSDFEFSHPPSDLEIPTVMAASTMTDSESGSKPSLPSDSSSYKGSVSSSSRTEGSNVSSESDRLTTTRGDSGDEDDDD